MARAETALERYRASLAGERVEGAAADLFQHVRAIVLNGFKERACLMTVNNLFFACCKGLHEHEQLGRLQGLLRSVYGD
jgi:hypothetical protein